MALDYIQHSMPAKVTFILWWWRKVDRCVGIGYLFIKVGHKQVIILFYHFYSIVLSCQNIIIIGAVVSAMLVCAACGVDLGC